MEPRETATQQAGVIGPAVLDAGVRDIRRRYRMPQVPFSIGQHGGVRLWRRRQPREDRSSTWSVAQAQRHGQPLIVRFDAAMAGDADLRLANPVRIGIAVPFTARLGPRDTDVLHTIEDTIEAATARRAVMVAILTTPQMREFVLYAASDDWFDDLQEDLGASLSKYDVQMVAELDPDWGAYFQFASR